MIVSKVSRHLARSAAAALILAPLPGAGLALPAAAEDAAKCEGTLLECIAIEAEAKLTAAPTKAPIVGETLASPSD